MWNHIVISRDKVLKMIQEGRWAYVPFRLGRTRRCGRFCLHICSTLRAEPHGCVDVTKQHIHTRGKGSDRARIYVVFGSVV